MGLPGGYDSDAEGGLAGSSGLTGGFGEKAVSFIPRFQITYPTLQK